MVRHGMLLRLMVKKIFLIIFLAAIIFAIAAAILFFSLFKYENSSGTFLIKAGIEDKAVLREAAKRIKDWIYREATIHNPEGDVLPDEIDDKVIKEIKNRVK